MIINCHALHWIIKIKRDYSSICMCKKIHPLIYRHIHSFECTCLNKHTPLKVISKNHALLYGRFTLVSLDILSNGIYKYRIAAELYLGLLHQNFNMQTYFFCCKCALLNWVVILPSIFMAILKDISTQCGE